LRDVTFVDPNATGEETSDQRIYPRLRRTDGWFLAFVLPKTDAGGIEQRCIERQRLLSWLRSFQKKPKLSLRYAGFTLLMFVQWDRRKRTKSQTS